MKTYESEPDFCEGCEGGETMTFVSGAAIDGKSGSATADGWLCDDCGHFHEKAGTRFNRDAYNAAQARKFTD